MSRTSVGQPAGGRLRAAAGLAVWLAFLAGALVWLVAAGRGSLATPPLDHNLAGWVSQHDPGVVVMALVRLVAVGVAVYLLVVTVAGVAARLVRARPLVALTDAITVPSVRRLINAAVGAGLAASIVSGSVAAGATPQHGGPGVAAERAAPPRPSGDAVAAPGPDEASRPAAEPTMTQLVGPPGSARSSTPAGDGPTTTVAPNGEAGGAPGSGDPSMTQLPDDGGGPADGAGVSPPVTMHRLPDPTGAAGATTTTGSGHPGDTGAGQTDTPTLSSPNPADPTDTAPARGLDPAAPNRSLPAAGQRGPATAGGPAPAGDPGAVAGDLGAAPAPAPELDPGTAPVTDRGPGAGSAATPATRTWVVRPGDSFWRIATETLASAWQRQPTDAEVDRYWRTLIDVNRAALADRHNADLIFPGQAFRLPPTPTP